MKYTYLPPVLESDGKHRGTRRKGPGSCRRKYPRNCHTGGFTPEQPYFGEGLQQYIKPGQYPPNMPLDLPD